MARGQRLPVPGGGVARRLTVFGLPVAGRRRVPNQRNAGQDSQNEKAQGPAARASVAHPTETALRAAIGVTEPDRDHDDAGADRDRDRRRHPGHGRRPGLVAEQVKPGQPGGGRERSPRRHGAQHQATHQPDQGV